MARISRGDLVRRKRDLERKHKEAIKEVEEATVELRRVELTIFRILENISRALDEGVMDRDEFYKLALDGAFPDEMLFELTREEEDSDKTFSVEGIEGIVDQMQSFILARCFAFWQRTGKPARKMRVALVVGFSEDERAKGDLPIEDQGLPWFAAGDTGGMLQIDGKVRIPRTKKSS